MNDSLITVIVPIYNVEKYLRKCIESILEQTYQKLEIILVDDGSTDNSGNICDEYAKKDKRIIVLHKENGGLSDARNVALDIVKGDYITCVDSDDYLARDYVEYLYLLLIKNGADISICSYKKVYTHNVQLDNCQEKVSVFNAEAALKELLYQRKIVPSAWGKLYRREMFSEIRYPKGMYYEDFAVIYKLLSECKKIAVGTQQKYYYLQRKDSIMNEEFNVKKIQRIQVVNDLKEYVDVRYPHLQKATSTRCFIAGLQVYREIPRGEKYKGYAEEAWQQIKKYRLETIKNNEAKLSTRIMALSSYLGKSALAVLGVVYTKTYLKSK